MNKYYYRRWRSVIERPKFWTLWTLELQDSYNISEKMQSSVIHLLHRIEWVPCGDLGNIEKFLRAIVDVDLPTL